MEIGLTTADWYSLGDSYFRKLELYSLSWNHEITDLGNFVVAGSSFGGPIAFRSTGNALKPFIHIFTCSGVRTSTIKWNSGKIIHVGWSNSEDLLCVQEDGTVLVYDIFGKFQRTFSFGQEVQEYGILSAKIFSNESKTGIAVLTTRFRFFLINNIEKATLRKLPEIQGLKSIPSDWALLSRDYNSKVLVTLGNQIILADQAGQVTLNKIAGDISGNIMKIAVSHNVSHVALYLDSNSIWLGSYDLDTKYCVHMLDNQTAPDQIVWCGSSAIVASWESNLLIVGIDGEWTMFAYCSRIHIISEPDCVRVISNDTHELIQKVPESTLSVMKIGSMESGSILLEASKEFKRGSHKADEYVRMVGNDLFTAVSQCVTAAREEFRADVQKSLLKAAWFGKGFLSVYNPSSFVDACQTLRVLNTLREYKVGIPLTYRQLEILTPLVLLDRLVNRRLYYLGVQIADYLHIPPEKGSNRVLAHWACYKVKQTQCDSEVIAKSIAEKLRSYAGISYSQIANKAAECGRNPLAIKLLEYENRACEQVPLLMKLGEDWTALKKAIESGDNDLVYMVLLYLNKKLSLGNFQMSIRTYPVAQSLYMKYLQLEKQRDLLMNFYVQEDDFDRQAECHLFDALNAKKKEICLSSLAEAQQAYAKSKNTFWSSICDEQHKIMKYQIQFEEQFNVPFYQKSLHDNLRQLLLINQLKTAEKLRTEFKVPEKRWCWLRLTTLAQLGDHDEIEKLGKAKKSPIGFEPFIDTLLQMGRDFEAKKYLPKVRSENKVKYCIKLGQYSEAVETAYQSKDEDAIQYLQSLHGPKYESLHRKLEQYNAVKK